MTRTDVTRMIPSRLNALCLSRGEFTIKKETFYLVGSRAIKVKNTTIQPGDKVRLYLRPDWDPEVISRPNEWRLAITSDHFYANDAISPFVMDVAVLGRAQKQPRKTTSIPSSEEQQFDSPQ